MNVGLAIFGAFIADSLMAYKIDLGIHDLKVMAGVADADWSFYSNINFYMMLFFGFCAYLIRPSKGLLIHLFEKNAVVFISLVF